MAIQIQGAGGSIVEAGAFAAEPMHVVSKPTDHGALGHYQIAATSGILAATLAANAQVFQFRWTDATRLAVITRLQMKFQALTPFTADVIERGFSLVKYTAISAGGGGTTVGAPSKMRTSMGASLVGSINISTTALLTAMTTADPVPLAQSMGDFMDTNPAAATEKVVSIPHVLLFKPELAHGEHPLVLAQNEGIAIFNRVLWPAAGTGAVQVEMTWAEVAAF